MRALPIRFVTLFFIAFACSDTKSQEIQKDEILSAIHSGSKYISEVLLDENGKSRCEYSMITGEWQDYEPAWHTGQLIYALVRAHDVSKNEKYLVTAKKAGDWWCRLQINDHPKLSGMLKAIHGAGIEYIVFATVSDGSAGLFKLQNRTGIDKLLSLESRDEPSLLIEAVNKYLSNYV